MNIDFVSPAKKKSNGVDEEYYFPRVKSKVSPEKSNFHIDVMKNSFRDLAKTNLFFVSIHPPEGLFDSEELRFTSDMVKSCTFPSVEIGKIEFSRMGNTYNMPSGDSSFGDCSITFWADVDQKVRTLFHQWQIFYVGNYEEYLGSVQNIQSKATLRMEQLDNNYDCTYGIELMHVWPSQIGDIQVSHDQEHQRQEFQVQFQYSYYAVYNES